MRCYHCMEEYSDTLDCCPHCHKTKESRTEPYQLLPGTLLNDRFYIGDMLGYGGFGITYIGWDALLCQKGSDQGISADASGRAKRTSGADRDL